MRHTKPRVKDLPVGSVPMGPEHFTGMQDSTLVMRDNDPRWATIISTAVASEVSRQETVDVPSAISNVTNPVTEIYRPPSSHLTTS